MNETTGLNEPGTARLERQFRVFFGANGVGTVMGANVAAFGKFDGIHLGHCALLRRAAESARRLGLAFGVATFARHPYAYLRPSAVPPVLTPLSDKLRLLRELGAQFVVLFPTDASVLGIPADSFARSILHAKMLTQIVFVGTDFRFGAGGTGDINTIRQLPKTGLDGVEVGTIKINGEPVSASSIRNRLANGDITGANLLLGRAYSVRGMRVAGTGSTTKVLVHPRRAVPAAGTYAVRIENDGDPSRLLTVSVNVASNQATSHIITARVATTELPIRAGPVSLIFLNRVGDAS